MPEIKTKNRSKTKIVEMVTLNSTRTHRRKPQKKQQRNWDGNRATGEWACFREPRKLTPTCQQTSAVCLQGGCEFMNV